MTRNPNRDAEFVRRLFIAAAVVIGVGIFWLLIPLLLLIFGAILIALTLQTLSYPLRRMGLGTKSAIVATTVLVAIGVGAVGLFFGSDLGQQIGNLTTRLDAVLSDLHRRFGAEASEALMKDAAPVTSIGPLLMSVLSWGWTAGQALIGFAFVLVAGLYLALDAKTYREGFVTLVPQTYQQNATATIADINEALNRWLGGMLTSMIIVGTLTGTGLWLAGIQSPLALGVLAGLANFVPYIGSIAAAIITLIIAAGQGWQPVISATIVMLVIQQIESNVIMPLVVGRAVSIMPATALFAMVAMALLFGPLGVLLGFPLAIVADILIRRLYIRDVLDKPVDILGEPAARSEHSPG